MSKIDERVRFTFRVPDKLAEKLRKESERLGVTVNALILQILWDWEKKLPK